MTGRTCCCAEAVGAKALGLDAESEVTAPFELYPAMPDVSPAPPFIATLLPEEPAQPPRQAAQTISIAAAHRRMAEPWGPVGGFRSRHGFGICHP